MSNLGPPAELVTVLVTKGFEKSLADLEKSTLAKFKNMAAASDNIISPKSFGGATAGVKTLENALKPLVADLKSVGVAGAGLGDGVATGAASATKQLKPMRDSIRGLSNELGDYKLALVSSDGAQDALAGSIANVVKNARLMREQVSQNSTEYGRLTGIIKSGTTTLNTAEKGMRGLGTGVVGLGDALPTLIGAAGIGGLVTAAGNFVGEAQRAESASNLFARAVVRAGEDSGTANALIDRLVDQFGVLPSVAQEAAATMLRAGGSLTDVDQALTAAGASAAAAGTNIGDALINVSRGAAQGRSAVRKAGVSAADPMTLLKIGTQLVAAENQDLTNSTALVLKIVIKSEKYSATIVTVPYAA